MIELRIEGRRADLKEELQISFTYETVDPDKLSTIKNSFSKTVDLPGTKRNNDLFGDLFRIDRYIPATTVPQSYNETDFESNVDQGTRNIGFQFDPHKKAEFNLLSNGELISSGYCTLNEIVVNGDNQATYKITLYGGIGNFFYNLTYNEDGSPRTLFDMYWSWRGKKYSIGHLDPYTSFEEDSEASILYTASASIMAQSYHSLQPLETIYELDEEPEGDPEEYEALWNYEYGMPYPVTDADKDIVLMPCYTGTYEDFDSKHMLLSTFNYWYNPGTPLYNQDDLDRLRKMYPLSFMDYSSNPDSPTEYKALTRNLDDQGAYRYGLVTFSRDLDPWEAGDIRVNEMPVAIRLSKLMRTISMPWNNGGYTVEWDKTITDSPCWNYSFVTLGKITQEKEEVSSVEIYSSQEYDGQQTVIGAPFAVDERYTNCYLYDEATPYELPITLSSSMPAENYSFIINVIPSISIITPANSYALSNESYKKIVSGSWNDHFVEINPHLEGYKFTWTTEVLIHRIYINNTLVKTIADVFYFTWTPSYYFGRNNKGINVNDIKQSLNDKLSEYYNVDTVTYHDCQYTADLTDISTDEKKINLTGSNVRIMTNIDVNNDITDFNVEQIQVMMWTRISSLDGIASGKYDNDVLRVTYDDSGLITSSISIVGIITYTDPRPDYRWETYWRFLPDSEYNKVYSFFNLNESRQNGLVLTKTSGYNTLTINKKKLFASSSSPFKYLADMVKMMNWRIVLNDNTKKIKIMPLTKYYKGQPKQIDSLVDYNKSISIKNVTTKYKKINFGLGSNESYPISLFNKRSRDKFNIYPYVTNVEYNTQDTNLLDNLLYKSGLDWQQSSVFYNIIPQYPRSSDTPSISWTLFNIGDDSDDIKKGETITLGIKSNDVSLQASNDFMPKLGLFDKDNKYTGNETQLVFLNGFIKNYDYNKVSESSLTETLTPDNINDNHYIRLSDYAIGSSGNYQIWEYNNIDENFEYRFSGRGTSASGQAFVYYYNAGGTCIGYEYKISEGPNLTDVPLHLPAGTKGIKVNMWKNYQSTFKVDKITNTSLYTIHPRVNFSEDTYEQYFFNGGRCFIYDFKYNDNFYSWGSWSSDQKGTATSWYLPFFTKDLYNQYVRIEDGYEYETVRLTPVRKYPNTKFAQNNVILSNTNYSQFEFWVPDPEPGWEIDAVLFNATYPATESGDVLWLQDYGTATIRYEGVYSPDGQHTFVDGAVNMSPSTTTGQPVRIIRMNTFIAQGGDETYYIDVRFKKPVYHYEWNGSDNIIASWNLVDQDQTTYSLDLANFIRDTNIALSRQTSDIGSVNSNEYAVNLATNDYDSVFDTNWKDYMNDLYDRNTRDVTLYINLLGLGSANDILRKIYKWKGFLWVITKIENRQVYQLGKESFTKCTIHKIKELETWERPDTRSSGFKNLSEKIYISNIEDLKNYEGENTVDTPETNTDEK